MTSMTCINSPNGQNKSAITTTRHETELVLNDSQSAYCMCNKGLKIEQAIMRITLVHEPIARSDQGQTNMAVGADADRTSSG